LLTPLSCSDPFFLCPMIRPPPRPTRFPYTTLFRSGRRVWMLPARLTARLLRNNPIFPELLELRGLLKRLVTPTRQGTPMRRGTLDRKSTRLNSSHVSISYAVFCLKKKKKEIYRYS